MPRSGPPLEGPVKIRDLLRRGLAADPDRFAIVSLDEAWSWAELDRRVDAHAVFGVLPDIGR